MQIACLPKENMTDRELLELAAKAAGYKWDIEIAEIRARKGLKALWLTPDDGSLGNTAWNPLESDGEALRLAVKLGITVERNAVLGGVCVFWHRSRVLRQELFELWNGDKVSATRRAIVRAAAEIGHSKRENS